MHAYSKEERALVLRRGLRERAQSVASAARQMLAAWLHSSCHNNVLHLLHCIGVERNPGAVSSEDKLLALFVGTLTICILAEVAEEAMQALCALDEVRPIHAAHLAAEQAQGLHQPDSAGFMSPEAAFYWYSD